MDNSVYYEDEDVVVKTEEAGGFIFIHTEISSNWNKSMLKRLKSGVEGLFKELESEGHEWAFATSDDEKSTRFWNMVKPCETVEKFGPNNEYWIGAWYFGED